MYTNSSGGRSMKNDPRLLFWGILSMYFLFIGYEVLHSTYLLTDDAFMLWHHPHSSIVFNVFHTQGRTITGWMEAALFTASDRSANVRYMRLLSLAEGVGLVLF